MKRISLSMRWLCHNFVGLIFLVPWKCLKLSSAIFLDATERERVSPRVIDMPLSTL